MRRRAFRKFCALSTSLLALPPGAARLLAEGLEMAKRLPVVWLSFQECTGCTESLTRSHAPSLEQLLFDLISLDYHHTLQAASGEAAEAAREASLKANHGKLLLVVDASIATTRTPPGWPPRPKRCRSCCAPGVSVPTASPWRRPTCRPWSTT
ncbi:MAG: hypothetical protein ACUVT2_10210 [Thiobacillaceae bacterium]